MKVYKSIEDISLIQRPVLTIGTFDGVHLGHQSILERLKQKALEINGETVVFTFHPHPRIALYPDDHGLLLIQPIEERIEKLDKLGIDHLVLFPFTKEFSRLSATEFVRNILVNALQIHTLIIGYNHHFGRNREGDFTLLKELSGVYGFHIEQIEAYEKMNNNISSTKIRAAVKLGDVVLANQFLGSPFSFKGKVVEGDRLGTKLGFPTANIHIDSLQLMPSNGVFAVKIKLEGTIYKGMMNIGNRPTVAEKGERRVEIHFFDFNQVIYGKELVVYLIERIREEKNFNSIEVLKEQLNKDEKLCRNLLDHSVSTVN